MSARPMRSIARSAAHGSGGAAFSANAPASFFSSRYFGCGGFTRILLHGILEQIEKLRDGGNHAVPVRDQRQTERVAAELGAGILHTASESGHGNLLGMPVELEPVQHGIGVIARNGILR